MRRTVKKPSRGKAPPKKVAKRKATRKTVARPKPEASLISVNAASVFESLLEAALFPRLMAVRARDLDRLERAELRDALARNGVPWGRLLHDWAVLHGQLPLIAAFGGDAYRRPRTQIDQTGFYEALQEISSMWPLEFSVPMYPRGEKGPIDPQQWPGSDLPRMPVHPNDEMRLSSRSTWMKVDLGTISFLSKGASIASRKRTSPAKNHAPEDLAVFGNASLDTGVVPVGEVWVRFEPASIDELLGSSPADALRTLSILGTGTLDLLRTRLHEQQEDFDQRDFVTVNEHLSAAAAWHQIVEHAAELIERNTNRRSSSAHASQILAMLRECVEAAEQEDPDRRDVDATTSGDGSEYETTDFVIVTALEQERDAVIALLPGCKKLEKSSDEQFTCFEAVVPTTRTDGTIYRVIVTCLTGMGPVRAATRAAAIVTRWRPRKILLVGIAGGRIGQVGLGDVIVADQIADYTVGKSHENGHRDERWRTHDADPGLLDTAIHVDDSWIARVTAKRPGSGRPKRRVGLVASGGDVIASSALIAEFAKDFARLVGVEMEGAGVASALQEAENKPGFLMIKGVSDLANATANASQKSKWRNYAACVAAVFAVELIRSGPFPANRISQAKKRSRSES